MTAWRPVAGPPRPGIMGGMTDTDAPTCAFPGCTNAVRSTRAGNKPRRYCPDPAHTMAAAVAATRRDDAAAPAAGREDPGDITTLIPAFTDADLAAAVAAAPGERAAAGVAPLEAPSGDAPDAQDTPVTPVATPQMAGIPAAGTPMIWAKPPGATGTPEPPATGDGAVPHVARVPVRLRLDGTSGQLQALVRQLHAVGVATQVVRGPRRTLSGRTRLVLDAIVPGGEPG
jgi:hypothetical protein